MADEHERAYPPDMAPLAVVLAQLAHTYRAANEERARLARLSCTGQLDAAVYGALDASLSRVVLRTANLHAEIGAILNALGEARRLHHEIETRLAEPSETPAG